MVLDFHRACVHARIQRARTILESSEGDEDAHLESLALVRAAEIAVDQTMQKLQILTYRTRETRKSDWSSLSVICNGYRESATTVFDAIEEKFDADLHLGRCCKSILSLGAASSGDFLSGKNKDILREANTILEQKRKRLQTSMEAVFLHELETLKEVMDWRQIREHKRKESLEADKQRERAAYLHKSKKAEERMMAYHESLKAGDECTAPLKLDHKTAFLSSICYPSSL